MSNHGFTYILARTPNGPFHVGTTSDIVRCLHEHRNGKAVDLEEGPEVLVLVHFERFDEMKEATDREEELEDWSRPRKRDLVREHNPRWQDLYVEACRTYGP